MPRDVFDDDDRVVDDESRRNRQGHQRKIVQTVACQIHKAESANQRHRDRDTRNQGAAQISQEQKDNQDHQANRDHQRELNFVQ